MSEPIRAHGQFWRGPAEAQTYLEAVRANAKGENEGAMSYIVRISDIVTGEEAVYQAQVVALRAQAGTLANVGNVER